MAKIKVAQLGLEHPHADFWQVAFHESEESELVGIWSLTPGLAAEKAEKFQCPAFEDRDALLDKADAVAICSVTSDHLELIEAAAAKGKKILCEKPLATSIDHCDRIQAVLERTGAFYMQGFPKRFDPVNHEIRRIIDTGGLGKITLVRVRHGHPVGMLNPNFDKTWFVDPELGGGGCLMDEGVHAADFIRWLFGEPEQVSCFISNEAQDIPVEDTGIAIYKYANGMIAEVTSCWHFMAAQNSVEIYGSSGSIVLSGVDLGSRDLTEDGFLKYYLHPEQTDPDADHLGPLDREWTVSDITPQFKLDTEVFHRNVARAFVDTLANDHAPPVTFKDGRRAVEMILAAYRAAESGQAERIQYG